VPLVVRAVRAARAAEHVDRVVVSTDDQRIAEAARDAGAEVLVRPAELASDDASSESAVIHALDAFADQDGYVPDVVALVQCTSPFVEAADISGTVGLVLNGSADSAFTATAFHGFVWARSDGRLAGVNHDPSHRPMRQDRPRELLETGAVYAMRVAGLREHRHRFFGAVAAFEIDSHRAREIDEPGDLELAQALEPTVSRRLHESLPPRVGAVVFDFDGVFTDNRVLVHEDGAESVLCNRSDGWGIGELRATGVPMVVISTEQNPVVSARCRKLGLECVQNARDKAAELERWLNDRAIPPSSVVFVGNDVNDVDCMKMVGCSVVVADAHPSVKRIADIVLSSPGGRGAVRELTDLVSAHESEAHHG
jgi:YrbI family 3-deoxy-D-manno-octulosonate 8-phosphate phosphatase